MSALFDEVLQDKGQLKTLSYPQLEKLCAEIRKFLVCHVSQTGGHLSSNLCTVELTVALHRVFDTPRDVLVFDVGHQCYTHKMLTGRADRFDTLRQPGGLSGFPSPFESEHDAFIAGHGNTAISAAVGIAQAKKLQGEPGKVIAIVGDGAFTGGMVYEPEGFAAAALRSVVPKDAGDAVLIEAADEVLDVILLEGGGTL